MKCSEWMEKLEILAPKSLACEWDNPGLLAGRAEKEVKKVLIALDATDDVVDLAVKEQVDLLITHHPLIFHSMKKVNDQDFIGRRLIKLIQADISMYAMHTNFDIAPGCMADLAAEKLGLAECEPLETMKLTAAIAGFAAGKEHAALIDAQSSAMGYVLGMTGSAALMLLFSTCCFMKVASG